MSADPKHGREARSSISRRAALAAGAGAVALAAFPPGSAASQAKRNIQTQGAAETMTFVTTKDGTLIFYKDWGPKNAQPLVFHHGWPLSSDDWDAQMLFFVAQGFRVVAHDRSRIGGARV